MDLGLLHEHLRIVREGERLLLPTKERVDLGFPTEQREFGTGFVAVRSYKDVVEVPDALRRSLPTSFDVIGDIAVLKIPEELQRYREQIGLSILRWNPKIRVAVQDRGVKGERRVRSIEVIAGERGICSGVFLEQAFRTVEFRIRVTIGPGDSWSYDEDTVLQVRGRAELFHHRDRNTLSRIAGPTPNPLAAAR